MQNNIMYIDSNLELDIKVITLAIQSPIIPLILNIFIIITIIVSECE